MKVETDWKEQVCLPRAVYPFLPSPHRWAEYQTKTVNGITLRLTFSRHCWRPRRGSTEDHCSRGNRPY